MAYYGIIPENTTYAPPGKKKPRLWIWLIVGVVVVAVIVAIVVVVFIFVIPATRKTSSVNPSGASPRNDSPSGADTSPKQYLVTSDGTVFSNPAYGAEDPPENPPFPYVMLCLKNNPNLCLGKRKDGTPSPVSAIPTAVSAAIVSRKNALKFDITEISKTGGLSKFKILDGTDRVLYGVPGVSETFFTTEIPSATENFEHRLVSIQENSDPFGSPILTPINTGNKKFNCLIMPDAVYPSEYIGYGAQKIGANCPLYGSPNVDGQWILEELI